MLTFRDTEVVSQLPDGHSQQVNAYFERRYGPQLTVDGFVAPERTQRYWRPSPGEADRRLSADPNDYPTTLLTGRILELIRDNSTIVRYPRVLEIGSAEGIEAVRFALMGAMVDACELTLSGAMKTKELAQRHDVARRVRVARIAAQKLELEYAVYGVVLNRGVLDYVETPQEKLAIIRKSQAATVVGGYNVVAAWAGDTVPTVPCHNEIPMYPDYGGLITTTAYDAPEWNILLSEIETKPDHSHLECIEEPHEHTHIKLIAQRVALG